MFFNYGTRNGVSTAIKYARLVCRLYTAFASPLTNYINSSSMSSEQKTMVINWLTAAVDVCMALESTIQVTYETR